MNSIEPINLLTLVLGIVLVVVVLFVAFILVNFIGIYVRAS